jgi:hypothetical protein
MTDEPVKASEVEKVDTRTEDERRREDQRKVTRAILARRTTLRKLGAVGTEDLAGLLEERLRRADQRVKDNHA